MKKLINDPATVVADFLVGFEAAHGAAVSVDHQQRVVTRRVIRPGTVGLVSGGGSGHEPLHAGFVGTGMLTAAVCGEVFTSPVPDQIMSAVGGVDSGSGVILIVKNYTGDIMNFSMAAEFVADATDIRVETVVVEDDVAVEDSTWTAGRRGVGLAVFMEKILGAAAEQGRPIEDLLDLAHRVGAGGRSFGIALGACTVPAVGRPMFDLADDELELGVGIHGEPGRSTVPLVPAHGIAPLLVDPILADLDYSGRRVLALLNGMGATPLMELYLQYGEVAGRLHESHVDVAGCLVGNYVTSLDMAGCSLTLLDVDDELLDLWRAPVSTPALTWGC